MGADLNTFTKQHFVKTLVEETALKGGQAKEIVDHFFQLLTETICDGNRIEIRGFGAWEVRQTAPRDNARNPRTGEIVSVPGRRKVVFKPGKIIKEELSKPLDA